VRIQYDIGMSVSHPGISIVRHDYQEMINRYRQEFEFKSKGFKLPVINYEFTMTKGECVSTPEFFVAIPIKNQEKLIREVLEGLVLRLNSPFDIGLLFDNCNDASFETAIDCISEVMAEHESLNQVHLVKSMDELFESTCENVLFELCKAKYFVSFQADTLIDDASFFERCKSAFTTIPNLLGVSGRATVPFMPSKLFRARLFSLFFTTNFLTFLSPRVFRNRRLGPFLKGNDYFGDTSGFPFPRMKFSRTELNTLFLGQALIRGPIVWSAGQFRKLGGFNDLAYFLGRDDCDLALRGLLDGLAVGYLPCQQISNPSYGTTRKPRSNEVVVKLQERAELHSAHPGTLDGYWNAEPRERKRILAMGDFRKIRINH
jgi:hypothetical protein